MYDDFIFMKAEAGLLRMERRRYDREIHLQDLVEHHPELLAGGQIRPHDPVRWLMVSREAGIPDRDGSGGRWAVDHLLLDQDAVPTFVEVKRSSDTRIRREVVGQMLDYAANATVYWPAGRIRDLVVESRGEDGMRDAVASLLGSDPSDVEAIDGYWKDVATNLRSGNVRLLFVADEIPRELRRIIEFLNESMTNVEVLGVEVIQYVGQGHQALVPRLVGQSEQARDVKGHTGSTAKTSEQDFDAVCPDQIRPYFQSLRQSATDRGLRVSWGTKGFSLRVVRDGRPLSVFYGYPPNSGAQEHASIQAYLPKDFPGETSGWARAAFLDAAPFRAAGEFTLILPVHDAESLQHAQRATAVLWELVDRLRDDRS